MEMLVNRATGLIRKPISIDRVRHGKTARERGENASRRRERQMARAAWQQDSQATNATFPK